jgi:putative tryptophan/tyrosine transport system substrate-binding protein
MRRREFIAGLGGAAAWPAVARGQQSKKIPVIGVLWPNPPSQFDFMRQGLTELGYIEGKNIRFEFRWAQGKLDQLPELAQDLVRIPVDLIVTLAPEATLAAQRATRTIPIVFVAMGDPLASGVVASLARPGANLTGTTRMISEMSAKHVELLKDIYGAAARLRASDVAWIRMPEGIIGGGEVSILGGIEPAQPACDRAVAIIPAIQ